MYQYKMSIDQLQKYITNSGSVDIAEGIEAAISAGALQTGEKLPTVRALADVLAVSPTTVSAAFANLKRRGLLVTRGRRGTVVSQRPALATPTGFGQVLPRGVRNLAAGNPNLAFLPDLRPALDRIETSPHLYGAEVVDPELVRLARRSFRASEIPVDAISVTSGALDGIERALQAHLRPGDRVAVEDPGFNGVLHLLASLGFVAVPVEIDDAGPLPEAVERVLREGVQAFVLTTRAQNPRGAALDAERVAELGPIFRAHPEVLLVEDDHAGVVSGAAALTLCANPPERWVVVRSVSKAYGPDMRLAVMASDPLTLARVEGRQLVGVRWVSFLLQRTVVAMWKDREVRTLLRNAARDYSMKRQALIDALAEWGIEAYGRSGLNVWVPVPEEGSVIAAMLKSGYAVAPGERFRLLSEPAIRITITTLACEEALPFAKSLASALRPDRRTFLA